MFLQSCENYFLNIYRSKKVLIRFEKAALNNNCLREGLKMSELRGKFSGVKNFIIDFASNYQLILKVLNSFKLLFAARKFNAFTD